MAGDRLDLRLTIKVSALHGSVETGRVIMSNQPLTEWRAIIARGHLCISSYDSVELLAP